MIYYSVKVFLLPIEYLLHERSYRNNSHIWHFTSSLIISRDAISGDDLVEMRAEVLVRFVWEDSMGSKCSHALCSFFSEHMSGFSEGSSSLYEVVYEEDISVSRISFFYRDDSLDPITHFRTDDSGVFRESFLESFCCPIVRESYHCIWIHIQQ